MFTVCIPKKNCKKIKLFQALKVKVYIYWVDFSACGGNNFSLLEFSTSTTKILSFTLYMFQVIFVMTSKED